jgi:hypothetical protein
MTSTHAAHPVARVPVQEGYVAKRSGLRRLIAPLLGESKDPGDGLTDPGGRAERTVEDRVRRQIAAEILAEVDRVTSAPAHVYAQRIAELSTGPADRLFWDGLLEGMLIAADVAGPHQESPAD